MNFEVASKQITPTIVLDIGAHQGHWTIEAQKVWPEAYYFCVEAQRECESALSFLNATYQIAVLSDTVKTVTFYTLKDCDCATGASYYRENTEYFEGDKAVAHTVETKTLDDICAPIDYKDSVLLVKLDCQGAELDVLRGGRAVLSSAAGVIVEASYSDYNLGAPKADEVDKYLYEAGFKQVAELDKIVHPINHNHIQSDLLYIRQ